MNAVGDILLGKGEQQIFLLAKYANRHGLVSGATGTGKTVSLLVIAEGLSRIGVPVFIADVKGDVAGLAMPGTLTPQLEQRARDVGSATSRPRRARSCSGISTAKPGIRFERPSARSVRRSSRACSS